jgi:hypothetical protein
MRNMKFLLFLSVLIFSSSLHARKYKIHNQTPYKLIVDVIFEIKGLDDYKNENINAGTTTTINARGHLLKTLKVDVEFQPATGVSSKTLRVFKTGSIGNILQGSRDIYITCEDSIKRMYIQGTDRVYGEISTELGYVIQTSKFRWHALSPKSGKLARFVYSGIGKTINSSTGELID